jgi:diguanylate cyclase (GGDEF)-like protein/PAS domain S-box-containing protein
MAKILIVDDIATNRRLLVAVLEPEGHAILEAVDGTDGLSVARVDLPDVIISDILMPSMDGYEFVRQLRAEPALAHIPVIFHTAHYHEREARHLAQSCRVACVLVKPSNAAEILGAVRNCLDGTRTQPGEVSAADFDREHLQLITNKLSQHTDKLRAANARLAALNALNVQLASERDPLVLLEKVCHEARNLLGSSYAVLAVRDMKTDETVFFSSSGLNVSGNPLTPPRVMSGALGKVVTERRSWRIVGSEGKSVAAGLPDSYPLARAVLAAPLSSLSHAYGWLCLVDKVGADGFSADDEQVLCVLGAQVGRIYENGKLYYEIQKSEERFRQLAENIPDAFFIITADYSKTLYISPAYERIWGRPCSTVYENPLAWSDSIHPDDRDRMRLESRWDSGGSATSSEFEYRVVRPDGVIRWVLARTFPVRAKDGVPARTIGVATDITERKLAEARVVHLNRVYAMLSGINSLIVRVTSRDELFNEACRLAVETGRFKSAWCGWNNDDGKVIPVAWAGDAPDLAQPVCPELPAEAHGDTVFMNVSRLQKAVICNDIGVIVSGVLDVKSMLQRGHRALVVLPLIIGNKSVGSLTLVTDEEEFFDDEEMMLLNELAGDISFALDHLEKADKLSYLAYYDAVTGLANHTFFHERLTQYVSTAERNGSKLALIIVDPHHFESINDAFGRQLGDRALRQLAERFGSCVGAHNAVGRVSANQFAAVIEGVKHEGDVARALEEWWACWLDRPFLIDSHELRLSASAGIAMFPADGGDAATLSRNAEAALKNAKSTGKKHLFYTRGLSEGIAARLSLENKLNHALENNEFVLHYQPKVDLLTRRLTGVEALIRWQSPERGLVAPMQFISVLEETGLIGQVGLWVVRQACMDRSRWLERGLNAPRVSVNVSTVQLRREDFLRTISNILKISGSEAGIDIEVTESLIMGNVGDSIEKLTTLRDMGVNIAIDDFGTGYSSLAYLARLPVGELKIDRSFVAAMFDDSSAMTLVSTIISLAHALKLEVVAEGVETEEQAKILRLLRCDQMQGYLISKPMSFDDMTGYLGTNRKIA